MTTGPATDRFETRREFKKTNPARPGEGATAMGRGDKRTKKGKIFRKSFGKSRPKTVHENHSKPEAPKPAVAPPAH